MHDSFPQSEALCSNQVIQNLVGWLSFVIVCSSRIIYVHHFMDHHQFTNLIHVEISKAVLLPVFRRQEFFDVRPSLLACEEPTVFIEHSLSESYPLPSIRIRIYPSSSCRSVTTLEWFPLCIYDTLSNVILEVGFGVC